MRTVLLNRTLLAFTLLNGILLAACSSEQPPPPEAPPQVAEPAVDPRVAKAAALAKAVDTNPDGAAAALEANGMTQADLDALMYEIAADPALTLAYQAERGR